MRGAAGHCSSLTWLQLVLWMQAGDVLQLLSAASLKLILYCPVDDMQSSQAGFYTQLKYHTKMNIVSSKKKKSQLGHTQ